MVTAKYVVANKIDHESTFVWWVKGVLRRRGRFIKMIKARFVKRTHSFDIEIPDNFKDNLELDKKNGSGAQP